MSGKEPFKQDGIQQVANLLTPLGISVYGFDLPPTQTGEFADDI